MRVKSARKERGLTLRQVAEQSGMSVGFLSQVERGVSSLRVAALFALSEALGVSPAELLGETPAESASTSESTSSLAVTTAGACLSLEIPGWPITYRWLSGPRSPLGAEMCIAEIPEHTSLPPSQHAGEEFGYILKGTIVVRSDASEFRLSAGDSFQLRATEPHEISTEDERAEVLFFQTVKYTEFGAAQALQVSPKATTGAAARRSDSSARKPADRRAASSGQEAPKTHRSGRAPARKKRVS